MGPIAGILAGIAAVVFFIFRGMSSNDTELATSNVGSVLQDTSSHGQAPTSHSNNSSSTLKVPERWKCTPYEQVGLIKANHSEADIKKFIGEENVVREQLGREWGETIPGTIVYPNIPNQLTVEWRDGRAYEVIESIRIEGENSDWQTTQGIKIGTTLEELKAINGKDFDFYGFEWDYAGKVGDWRNGKISNGIVVFLTPDNPRAIFPEMIGDTLFSASHHKTAEAKLKVSAIEIKMRKGIHF